MTRVNTTFAPKVEYSPIKTPCFDHQIVISNEDGTRSGYTGDNNNPFPMTIYNNMTKYSTEDNPNITAEETYKLLEDITLECLSDNSNSYGTGAVGDIGIYVGKMSGKNSYIEALKGLIDLYSNEEFSEGGKDITVDEQAKIIETFLKSDWTEIEENEIISPENDSKPNNTQKSEGFLGWLKSIFN